ncbi:Xaa-Pro peptidase family protein [bacterium]|nr:Xaa-Pro peptidase family protein [bacterium]
MHSVRLAGIRNQMSAKNLEVMLITNMQNIFYLSGFTGSTAAMVITADKSYILVDPRYSIQARSECKDSEVRDYTRIAAVVAAASLIKELNAKSVGYEADNLVISSFGKLRRALGPGIKSRSTTGMVEKIRRIKDPDELALIRHACSIVDTTFEKIIQEIRPGMTENEIALFIDTNMRKLGAEHEGFSTIAAAGPNSACPHHSPTDAMLKTGQFLKMDYGAQYMRYNSDITRTIFFGKPTAKHREVYQTVLDAQMKAIESIAPGKNCRDIDAVAREYIASKGYGDNFGHGLGHSLGIDVHEEPRFSPTCDVVLEPGMVMTVEPGIYIEGWAGVRIEDDVLVTDTGCEVLTSANKELICI